MQAKEVLPLKRSEYLARRRRARVAAMMLFALIMGFVSAAPPEHHGKAQRHGEQQRERKIRQQQDIEVDHSLDGRHLLSGRYQCSRRWGRKRAKERLYRGAADPKRCRKVCGLWQASPLSNLSVAGFAATAPLVGEPLAYRRVFGVWRFAPVCTAGAKSFPCGR